MTESNPWVQFPVPSTFTLVMLGLGFGALLFAAVGYEIYRRVHAIQARSAAEWRHVPQILAARERAPASRVRVERRVEPSGDSTPLRPLPTPAR